MISFTQNIHTVDTPLLTREDQIFVSTKYD